MTWAGLYPWLLVFHVLCVFAFLAIHGVSMGVWWRVRRERDRGKLVALLGLSVGFITPMSVALLLLMVSGIVVGVAAAWWFNGQWWLWASIGLLVVIIAVMTPLIAIPMSEIRRGLGMPSQADARAGTSPTPVDDAALDRLLRDRRPVVGSSIAIGGIVLITWLMETKPF
ncbi:MAG: hypothetical protein ACYDAK_06545 [Candidatus Limnocylindrales bacterium]